MTATDDLTVEDIDFSDPAFLASPWTELVRLQKQAPVFYSKKQAGWILSRHEDVKAGFADRRLSAARNDYFFRDMPPGLKEKLSAVVEFNSLNVNRMDGRDHTRIRVLLMKAFDSRVVEKVKNFLGALIDEILDECEQLGEFDFMKVVSAQLPTRVMQRLFDMPDEYRPILFKLASDFTSASTAPKITEDHLTRLDATIREMNVVLDTFIAERERNPGDDLISYMVNARDGTNRLTHAEMVAQLQGLIIAGGETTAHTLATQLVQIASQPKLQRLLRETPERGFDLVTELLRYPGTVKFMTRYAAEDIEIRGQAIAKGDLIWLSHAAANVDDEVFEYPFETNVDRPNPREFMSFGPGMHFCIGHLLARTELVEFFARTFQRFDVEILQDQPEMQPSFIFYGYQHLQVRFVPR